MSEKAAPLIGAEGVDGTHAVEGLRCGNYLAWVSRVSKSDFADLLAERMQDLEWLAAAGLRHQRIVAEISGKIPALPARFGTVFLSEDSLAQHVKQRTAALAAAFERVADADEWGVKVFAAPRPKPRAVTKATSGSDYLKRKAQLLQPRTGKMDADVNEFIAALTKLAAATGPGGKVSTGQPGLLWHGSFLIRRKDRARLESLLGDYAAKWKDLRRIDCTGPWPPYSFVEEHVH